MRELLRAAGLCSNARLVPPPADAGGRPQPDRTGWRVLGDTTEVALLVAAAKAGVDLSDEEAAAHRVAEYPFDSDRKLMSTVHKTSDGYRAYVKGAPQELLARCTAIDWRGERQPLTDELRAAVTAASDQLASQGLRVLAAASRPLDDSRPARHEVERELTLLGLVGMLDPPRPEVSDAVDACRRAGIRIVRSPETIR
ncbi:hypothetical protein [Streptomyces formicae]|uniref:hypothetical protein n=1 Tax=Streptomyces formicae TaxID=1616117 RepID=UPI001F578C1F